MSGYSHHDDNEAFWAGQATPPGHDPRDILDGLGLGPRLTEHILGWLAARGIGDPFGYLLKIIGRPEHDPDGIKQFIAARSREIGETPRPPKPPWCGECDKRTRLTGSPDRPARCIRCHPASLRPPADAPATLGNPARSALVLGETPSNPDAADHAHRGAAAARDLLAEARRRAAAAEHADTGPGR